MADRNPYRDLDDPRRDAWFEGHVAGYDHGQIPRARLAQLIWLALFEHGLCCGNCRAADLNRVSEEDRIALLLGVDRARAAAAPEPVAP